MKSVRQQKILEIIEKYDIATQDELLLKLEEAGILATQTTISRDIRQLGIIKYRLLQLVHEVQVMYLLRQLVDMIGLHLLIN